jgi:alcohol dehydrogenase class IV
MGFITKNTPLSRHGIVFFIPTEIKAGPGRIQKLAVELQIEPDLAERNSVVLVTDQGVAGAGLVEKVEAGLADSPYEIKAIFDDVPSDSDLDVVRTCGQLLTDHQADLIIALGGGSVMDTAKAGSIIAAHGGELRDYEGGFIVPGPCIPVIAIPTTTGTGSEVTMGAVIKDRESKTKITIVSPYMFPRMAVLDPEMVRTLPPKLVAYTGMDALTHAIEAYVSAEHEPFSEALAFRVVEMVFDNLEEAVNNPENLDARAKMQLAATMAGVALNIAVLGATHAITHAIGARFGIHHGLGNAVGLPTVMEYNLEACPERFAALARAMGVSETNLSDEELGRLAIEKVRALRRRLDIPERFRDLGVPTDEEVLAELAETALHDLMLATNPRKTRRAEMKALMAKVV